MLNKYPKFNIQTGLQLYRISHLVGSECKFDLFQVQTNFFKSEETQSIVSVSALVGCTSIIFFIFFRKLMRIIEPRSHEGIAPNLFKSYSIYAVSHILPFCECKVKIIHIKFTLNYTETFELEV